MIPIEQVKKDPEPPEALLDLSNSTNNLPDSSPPSSTQCLDIPTALNDSHPLHSQILLSQPLATSYPRLIKLAAENGSATPQRYQENEGALLHQGCWWVPEGPLRLEVIQSHHDLLAASHPGKTKTIELIQRYYSWKGITANVAR
ncbi:hypothetical protein DSO57_1022382 [Entomophthora muscae]|uniref:Uncharacterized protein n=1 Tax=Entomophthora muscae TaxID=34485 RepID=A0ACC2UNA5_9FUNG|nr:hypothetical protein DSO57_1022382 [Entomophthora muscae]